MRQQTPGPARVLGRDQVDLSQGHDRARRQVAEVPDRRRHHVEGSRHPRSLGVTETGRSQLPANVTGALTRRPNRGPK